MRVRFTAGYVVDDCRKGTASEERYEAGRDYDLAEASARHFIDRGKAVLVDGTEPASVAPAAADISERPQGQRGRAVPSRMARGGR